MGIWPTASKETTLGHVSLMQMTDYGKISICMREKYDKIKTRSTIPIRFKEVFGFRFFSILFQWVLFQSRFKTMQIDTLLHFPLFKMAKVSEKSD